MLHQLITTYIADVLTPQLKEYHVPEQAVQMVGEDIQQRLSSLLARWNDVAFRHTILSMGLEEGYFYVPKKNVELRAMVINTVRNSLIEELHTTAPTSILQLPKAGLIKQRDVAYFTMEAIEFFSKEDLANITMPVPTKHDVFGKLKAQYPLAWEVMENLGYLLFRAPFSEVTYAPVNKHQTMESGSREDATKNRLQPFLKSAINEDIDENLRERLDCLVEHAPMYVPSFARLSRSPVLVFRVLQEVLSKNAMFVTDNLYLKRGYVAKRNVFVKPCYELENLRNIKGLTREHRFCVKMVARSVL